MNPEVKKKWITALRSGEYKQTKHVLKCGIFEDYFTEMRPKAAGSDKEMTINSFGFCCLGVLCDLHSKESNKLWEETKLRFCEFEYDGATTTLPDSVKEWAGLETHDGTINSNKTLTSLNDLGISFSQIADEIEKHF